MQPLDDLLSSPEKETGSDQGYDDEDEAPNNDQYESGDDEDEAGSEDMDIETSAIAKATTIRCID